jgi:hypothetical protein
MPERLEVTTDHQKLEVKLERGGTVSGAPGYDRVAPRPRTGNPTSR